MTGTLESYNFAGGIHLANQDYTVCIRQEAGYCSIEYTADTFQVSLGVDGLPHPSTAEELANIPLSTAKSGVDNIVCQTDYIIIPQGKKAESCPDISPKSPHNYRRSHSWS